MKQEILRIIHLSDLHYYDAAAAFGGFGLLSALQGSLALVRLSRHQRSIIQTMNADLSAICGDVPFLCVISGDLCTLPYPSTSLDVLFDYFTQAGRVTVAGGYQVDGLALDQATLVATLGNHDRCLHKPAPTKPVCPQEWEASKWRTVSGVLSDGIFRYQVLGWEFILFLVNSCQFALPRGNVTAQQTNWLQSSFRRLPRGPGVVRALVLHHSPLPQAHFAHSFNGARRLMALCQNEVDIILFGHTHTPLVDLSHGTVVVNAGTTWATVMGLGSIFGTTPNNLQVLTFFDDGSLWVEQYFWRKTQFSLQGGLTRTYNKSRGVGYV